MQYCYESKVGYLLIEANTTHITGLDFLDHPLDVKDKSPLIHQARTWLDAYFHGIETPLPPIEITGTPFQKRVMELLKNVRYGEVRTYKQLAEEYCKTYHVKHMSYRAIGSALSKNCLVIMLPCHRIVGTHGIGGFTGGIERKKILLDLEASHNHK